VADVVERCKRGGALRQDLQPAGAALIVTSFVMGAMTQLGVSPESLDFEDLSRELERLLSRGVPVRSRA
jgi:hypothetical protein